jgi:uncharacterized protein (TIGR03435 family)
MKRPEEDNINKVFEQVLHSTPQQEMEAAGGRVLHRLRTLQVERAGDSQVVHVHSRQAWRLIAAVGLVAATILFAAVLRNSILSHRVLAEATDSGMDHIANGESLKAGQSLYTNTGASLKLLDGSRVEMRTGSELVLERADDGVRIRLKRGGIIVNAARQGHGHLYVQTKEVSVSVVGTVFLVNAEEVGSRVAVIEGEVRLEQGATTKKLQPGDDVATNPIMAGPVRDALSWSRNAESHLALLQQTTVAAQKGNRFSVTAIRSVGPRPAGPASLSADTESRGFGCHGIDGIPRAIFGAGPEIPIPQGRCVGNGINLMGLINYAYGSPWRFGPGVPDWARTGLARCESGGCFQINAAADNPDTTTTAQLRAMLQTMLSDRFKVQLHRETQNVQAYVFHVAKNGPRLKEYTGEIEPPAWAGLDIRGKSSLDELARFLTDFSVAFVNLGNIDTPFLNRTGLTGVYDYELSLRPSGGGARGGDPNAGPPSRESRLSQLVDGMSVGLEEDLGLRLDMERLPVEIIIVDHVEKPTEN